MKKLLILGFSLMTLSCMDFAKRQRNLEQMYPKNIVTPSTGFLKENGYEFLMEDTTNNQIYAVSFQAWSYKKISSIRNIK